MNAVSILSDTEIAVERVQKFANSSAAIPSDSDNMMQNMSQEIEKLAGRYHLPYIFLHDCLNAEARRYGLDAITLDGIHLTTQGHEILAQKLMEVISQNG